MDLNESKKHGLDSSLMQLQHVANCYSNMFFPNTTQFCESCLSQEFSAPIPVMKYMWENPSSSDSYQKLIKCCKIFFLKNPILVFKNLEYHFFYGWQYCNNNECKGMFCGHELKKIDMENIQSQIWITERFGISTQQKSCLTSDLIPYIFRPNNTKLILFNQELSYEEVKFLSNDIENVLLGYNVVKYDNGEEVPLENVIKAFSGAEKVLIDFASLPGDIGCKSYDEFFDACKSVKAVKFFRIPLDFDVPNFYQHVKRCKNCTVIAIYADPIYQRHDDLEVVINEILATNSFDFVPPVINNTGLNDENFVKMKEIQSYEAAKYH